MSDAVTVTDEMVGAARRAWLDSGRDKAMAPSRDYLRQALEAALTTQPQDQRVAELEAERELTIASHNTMAEERDQALAHAEQLREGLESVLLDYRHALKEMVSLYLAGLSSQTPTEHEIRKGEFTQKIERLEQALSLTPPQALSKRDGEVLILRDALTARIWHDAALTEKMRRYIVPSVDPNSIEADEFIAAVIEHLDGPHQRKNDEATRQALRSTTQAAQDAEDAIRADEREKCAKIVEGYRLDVPLSEFIHTTPVDLLEGAATAIRSLSSKGEG